MNLCIYKKCRILSLNSDCLLGLNLGYDRLVEEISARRHNTTRLNLPLIDITTQLAISHKLFVLKNSLFLLLSGKYAFDFLTIYKYLVLSSHKIVIFIALFTFFRLALRCVLQLLLLIISYILLDYV